MNNREIYELFKNINLFEGEKRKNLIRYAQRTLELDYRTVVGLDKFISHSDEATDPVIKKLTDKNFYTFENAIKLHKAGMDDLIPHYFYSDDIFLKESGITSLPADFLFECETITSFTLGSGIKEIGPGAFKDCINLNMVILNESLKTIGEFAFAGCLGLRNIILPPHLTKIGMYAFKDCIELSFLSIPKGVKELKDGTFENCFMLKDINIDTPIVVNKKCFSSCRSLSSFDAKLLYVGSKAFRDCVNIKEITFKADHIGKYAFIGCKNLHTLHFKKLPSYIGEYAFMGNKMLKNIDYPGHKYVLRSKPWFDELFVNTDYTEGSLIFRKQETPYFYKWLDEL